MTSGVVGNRQPLSRQSNLQATSGAENIRQEFTQQVTRDISLYHAVLTISQQYATWGGGGGG